MTVIGVTGATGSLGGGVARELAARGVPLRLVVRDLARGPDLPGATLAQAAYGDTADLERAFEGVTTLLFVSAAEHPQRVAQHEAVAVAAAAAGVERVVYTSFLGAAPDAVFTLARDHHATEQALSAAGLVVTALRDGFYQDLLPTFYDASGVLRGPAGAGRLSAVARRDVAACVLVALLDDAHAGRTYELTGPEALTLDEVSAQLSAVTGRALRFEHETVEQAYASRAHYGAAPFQVDAWVSTYTAIAAGQLATVSGDVERLTGRPATAFATLLREQPELWAHLAR